MGRLLSSEIEALGRLGESLTARVIGQDEALRTIAERVKVARADLVEEGRPMGVFLQIAVGI